MLNVRAILEKAVAGERLSFEEGVRIFREADLLELGLAARAVRERLVPGPLATFVVDRNINYTNVCVARCSFCAFYRLYGDEEAYVLPYEVVLQKIEELVRLGGTQILMQGGHHPRLPWGWYLELLRTIRAHYPQVDIHAFSPSELVHFSRIYRMPLRQVVEELKEAGLHSVPGGGAEILVDRVRREISPYKNTADEWLAACRAVAEAGLKMSATMMYGHVETIEERIMHLERLRQLQEECGVFRAFSCWNFQPKNTALEARVSRPTTSADYLRTVAVARLYLDNIPHMQASWVTQGPKVGQLALAFGCDDMGGTMMEENVVSQAGTIFHASRDILIRLIRDAGYIPAKRNTRYEILEVYGEEARVHQPEPLEIPVVGVQG